MSLAAAAIPPSECRRVCVALALMLGLLAAAPGLRSARAQVDPFEFEVYPYRTVGEGVAELEWLNSYVPWGHQHGEIGTSAGTLPSNQMLRTSGELTYGLTDHVEAAGYLNLARPNAGEVQYGGAKFHLRGNLFEQGELPVDIGWYVELESWPTPGIDTDPLELELKPILEKDIGRWSFILNPIFEKPVFTGPDRNRGFEFGYANGVYYRWMPRISPGLEFYGGSGFIDGFLPVQTQQHYIFAVLWGELPWGGVEYNCGPGVGLTHGSDHVITKCNLEIERFVGALL